MSSSATTVGPWTVWFEGGFSEYEENYKKRVGDIIPQRSKYKKLVRG